MIFSSSTLQRPLVLISCVLYIASVNAQRQCVNDDCRNDNLISRDADLKNTMDALMRWIVVDNGGFVNPKLEIRTHLAKFYELKDSEEDEESSEEEEESSEEEEKDQMYSFGIYVKSNETVDDGELLLHFPDETIICSDKKSALDEYNTCLLSAEIMEERNLNYGNQSQYGPYIDFLEKYVIGDVRLPATWSENGQYLLGNITESDYFTKIEPYYRCLVQGGSQEEIERIFNESGYEGFGDPEFWDENIEIALSRGRHQHLLIPIYDMINHSNDPKKMNVEKKNVGNPNDNSFSVFASRDVQASEELHHSYGIGTPKENHWHGYVDYGMGTMDMFRTYGFIESYPQRWFFKEHNLDFFVRESETDDATDQNGPALTVDWRSGRIPDDDALYTLRINRDELVDIRQQMIDALSIQGNGTDGTLLTGLSPYEIQISFKFLQSYIAAVHTASSAVEAMNKEIGYLVSEEKFVIDNLDNIYYQRYQCDTMITKIARNEFASIDRFRSAYQQIEYYKDPATQDRCLYLDGVYQQCISYWPHYHELVVHKPSKYIKEGLKRVLWVGGGDSGVLNEFLKYPTLELAVGLELDQQVTRSAFKHFGSRPHYDNPKVQWWYGDASKSLLMLPEDYFGSFDLVIVDLSDTVFSLSVSAELDVIEAISLLLRPGGIFEMNELFMKKVSNVFEYAVHYNFNDVPKILDQAAIFASNDVDFMQQELTEHTLVENATLLVEKDSMLTKHQFDRVHDYRHNPNPAFKKLCKKVQDADDKEADDDKPQSTAPGIMMIVEAENLTADLSSPTSVRTSITNAIEKVGLTVVVSAKSSSVESPWFVIMMEEGYVVARLWAEEKYCALDIHLWSSFDNHEGLKEAIVVGALGGDLLNKSTSSYRIVAGGMFGLSDWKDESKKHGPQLDQLCSTSKGPLRDQASSLEVQLQALELCLEVLQGTGLTAVVLCGPESDGCPSLNVVKVGDKFDRVIPLYDTVLKDGDDQRLATLARAKETLDSNISEKSAFLDAIFFDSASTVLANDILNMILLQESLINLDKVFFAATIDSKSEIWRRRTLMSLRDEIELDPVYRAQFLLNTTDSTLELSITASGDPFHMEHIAGAVAESQREGASATAEIRTILGGNWRDDNSTVYSSFNASFEAVAHDYDRVDAMEQWDFQSPLATQTLLQFSNSVGGTPTILFKSEVVAACKEVFATRNGSSVMVYDSFGGDGAICAGNWKTGIAVISWDGRYQIDLNIFSTSEKDELNEFENDIKMRLSNLEGWLRDIQPRGYGRVVNFKEAKMPGKSSLFVDAL